MRIIVVSDSHRNARRLEQVVKRHQADADFFLHLGDGLQECELVSALYPGPRFLRVRGNCDHSGGAPDDDVLVCGGTRIFYTHGHLHNVKTSVRELLDTALVARAKAALYGHTHIAKCEYLEGIYLMNPGSLGEPRGGPPSYGVVDLTPQGIVCYTVDLQSLQI